MPPTNTPAAADAPPTTSHTETRDRLSAQDRRDSLLDIARELVRDVGVSGTTIGSIAERGQVTRALVYKHFANREDLLFALYLREALAVDRELRRRVDETAGGFEVKLRAFVQAVLDAHAAYGPLLTPLRSSGFEPDLRREQRSADRRAVRYFAALAEHEFGLAPGTSTIAVSVLLAGLNEVLARGLVAQTGDQSADFEELAARMAIGALAALAPGHKH